MKTYEEKTQRVFQKIEEAEAIQKKRSRTIKRAAAPILSFCLVAVIGFGAWQSGVFQKPPMISSPDGSAEGYTDPGSAPISALPGNDTANESVADPTNESADPSVPNTQMQTGNEVVPAEPPVGEQVISGGQESELPTENPTVVPTNPEPSGSPMGVYTTLEVSYDEAKKIFGCPIVECTSSNFLGYKVGIVSRNGNIDSNEALCYDVTYEFTDGNICIQDQDRSIGKLANPGIERYDYLGRTFVAENSYDDERVMIGYYPTDMNGFAYLAIFDNSVDVYEIMDLIISVEIK